MSSASTNISSVPFKKRSKVDKKDTLTAGVASSKEPIEEAAAALASLSDKSMKPSASSHAQGRKVDNLKSSDADVSDSEESYSSTNNVMPKPVHAPPVNQMMVDHTYKNYSVINERSLAFLEEGEEFQSKLSDEEKKKQNKRVEKLRQMFGEVGPSKKNSGGVVKPFPEKLMEVLNRIDMETIITWMPHGRAFIVLQPQQLRDIVLPRFFKQTKFMSFTRQLNLWGFKRITKGVDSGAYYHELFLRGRPRLAMLMRRQKIKGTGIKLTPNPETEPNFYNISEKSPLPPIDPSKRESKPLPPLCHTSPSRNLYSNAAGALEYDNMVRRLNSRPQQQGFEQQIYPFNNSYGVASSNPTGLMFDRMNSVNMPNMRNEFQMQLLLQQQQHQPPRSAELLSILHQKALLEQQQAQQQSISSAQQLLGQMNSPALLPISDNLQLQELKQRLLNAASTLDQFNQPQEILPHQRRSLLGSNQLLPSLMAPPQPQPQNNDNIAVLMNALENTRNVAYATQERLEQVTRDLANAINRRSG